jgi:hypothetical protein
MLGRKLRIAAWIYFNAKNAKVLCCLAIVVGMYREGRGESRHRGSKAEKEGLFTYLGTIDDTLASE